MATREVMLAEAFLELANSVVDDFDVIELLTTLSSRCVELLDASASGILLVDPDGALQVVAASSAKATLLELFQLQDAEGPCLDAFRTGTPVMHDNLANESPWPGFARAAIAAGLPSVHAFPMRLRENILGTLNLFMARTGPLSAADVTIAQALTHAATIALLQQKSVSDLQQMTAQLQEALNSRVLIEQAKGIIAERTGVGMDDAFQRLRSYSRENHIKLTRVAQAVVAHTLKTAEIETLVSGSRTAE